MWRAVHVFALAICLFAPLLNTHAQQASTAVAQTPAATTLPPPPHQLKLQPANATDAGLPVITVLHRLSGWRLRALLARPGVPLTASTFDDQFIRTNIVAGYVLPDGRSVVARLPRADAEMLDLTAQFRRGGIQAMAEPPALTLMRGDGSEINASFVGLDATTGLSLLEAAQLIAPSVPARVSPTPTVGQRVRVFAPVPVAATPVARAKPATPADSAPQGEEGVIYMNMSEAAGQLTQIKRSPTGKPTEVTVEVKQVSHEWAGGVAFGEAGTLVGIVATSDAREARLVSADTVRAAAARVLARRASVPQPWLGARGDSVALAPLDLFVARGWPTREARALLSRRQGVLLTEVAPGTPAALAGLRAGDVVSRISQREVRSVEDMSQLLQELGGNTVARFTVLRTQVPPLELAVRLSEARNPPLETAQAEARAAEAELRLARSEFRLAEAEARVNELKFHETQDEVHARAAALNAADAAHRADEAKRLQEAQARLRAGQTHGNKAQARIKAANVRVHESRKRLAEAEARIESASLTHFGLPAPVLLRYGLEAIQTWPQDAANSGAAAGLLVIAVRPQSAAARAGLQPGDIVETIAGRRVSDAGISPPPSPEMNLTLGVIRDRQKLTVNLAREPEN